MWILKFVLIVVFFLVFFQDYKDRKVYWFLYPIIGAMVFVLQIQSVSIYPAFINTSFNLVFISLLLFVSYLYAKYKLQQPLLKEVFGLGDLLFFVSIAFSFSIVSFLILFVFSLVFSLLLHFTIRYKQTEKTVPLAGYMSLFFATVYGISFFWESNFLYAY
ncbi:general secretion pathway protein [Flavobacterium eburneipallidum]|uniref:general secretion pathway protein n=1 Tax=Flavobacterium eburneipallidum TaxID=3003263 RepID=UPI002482D61B|nr:general secretion pathway protein [Flavobacterium eburneipallidum]